MSETLNDAWNLRSVASIAPAMMATSRGNAEIGQPDAKRGDAQEQHARDERPQRREV